MHFNYAILLFWHLVVPSAEVHNVSSQLKMLQSKEGCSGNSPLFKLRLTHLGDGSSLLTASWSHALTDGKLLVFDHCTMQEQVDCQVRRTVALGASHTLKVKCHQKKSLRLLESCMPFWCVLDWHHNIHLAWLQTETS